MWFGTRRSETTWVYHADVRDFQQKSAGKRSLEDTSPRSATLAWQSSNRPPATPGALLSQK
jgi:hypothetical protein